LPARECASSDATSTCNPGKAGSRTRDAGTRRREKPRVRFAYPGCLTGLLDRLVAWKLQELHDVDQLDALHHAEQVVEPGLVRAADDRQHARAGTLAECRAHIGDHAQVARVPARDVELAEALR